MSTIKKWLYKKYLEFKFREYGDDICCCGSTITNTWCGSPWPCRSQKEYAITTAIDKIK